MEAINFDYENNKFNCQVEKSSKLKEDTSWSEWVLESNLIVVIARCEMGIITHLQT